MTGSRALFALLLLTAVLCRQALPAASGSQRQIDVAYGDHPRQRLDFYWPDSIAADSSVVIFIHGGSLQTGDKTDDEYGRVWQQFAASGIPFASVNYRLMSDSLWPAQIEDCARAVAWVREAMLRHGFIHPRIILFGHSSGATLVALLASDERYLRAHGIAPRDLAGVIPMGSIMWDEGFDAAARRFSPDSLRVLFAKSDDRVFGSPDAYAAHWPMHNINAKMPPFLFLIAEAEQEIPPILNHAKAFSDSCRALGVAAEWHVLKDRDHTTAISRISEPKDPAFTLVRVFLAKRCPAIPDK